MVRRALVMLGLVATVLCLATRLSAQCTTIQSGLLKAADGMTTLETGYDQWGYNYQAHTFNGLYANYLRPPVPYTEENCADYDPDHPEWGCINLQMKWNDAWLSNKDCDGDFKLDRHYGFLSYSGSGAWLTNHQSGSAEVSVNGKVKEAHWTYFVKIVAAPSDATKTDGKWYTADGTEIGEAIWGAFAIIQTVENDPFAGIHGIQYNSPASPGFGTYGVHP